MDSQHEPARPDEPPPIRDRDDTGGPWSVVWPLIALGLIGLIALSTCVTGLPAAPATLAPAVAPASR